MENTLEQILQKMEEINKNYETLIREVRDITVGHVNIETGEVKYSLNTEKRCECHGADIIGIGANGEVIYKPSTK